MGKANQPLRTELKEKGIAYWQVAAYIGVHETTLLRWLRTPLSNEKYVSIQNAVQHIVKLRDGGEENADSTFQ